MGTIASWINAQISTAYGASRMENFDSSLDLINIKKLSDMNVIYT